MYKVLSVVICACVLTPAALGCRCIEPKTTRVAYKLAQVVVVAKVLEVRTTPGSDSQTAVLSVSQAWKKDVPSQLIVVSATTCRYDLSTDHEYLLYLSHDPKMLGGKKPTTYTTGICRGNQEYGKATNALAWLRHNGRASAIRPAASKSSSPVKL